jgi:putative transposase
MSKVFCALEISRSHVHKRLTQGTQKRLTKILTEEDMRLLSLIREITDERPTYGYRRVTALLKKKSQENVNHKRVYRVMRQAGLLLKKPVKNHDGKVMTLKSNLRWCSDAFSIQCWNADQIHIAFSQDCHDREIISWIASSKGIDRFMIQDLIAESVEKRFGKVLHLPHPLQWLSDNGSPYVARETVAFGRSLGMVMCTTAPRSPESNGMAEAFVKTFKRDYVTFGNLASAQAVLEQLPKWFEDYNEKAPHKGLKMLSPRQYLLQIKAA